MAFDHDLDREVASIIDITEAYVRDANGVSARRREEGMGEEDAKKKIDSAQIELMSCVQAARNLLKKQ
ncbi:hypothetical protein EON65_17695 [archaeon]|nr:MAG: hypothetical protein EON65_17695 [archaeon]